MKRRDEIEGLRVLTGEASPEQRRAFAERLAREPELRAWFERRRAAWDRLELPAVATIPGFTGRVLARAAGEASPGTPVLPLAWRRLVAVLALVVGAAAGAGLGALGEGAEAVDNGVEVWQDESLAAAYLEAVESAPAANGNGGESELGAP